MKNCIIFNWLIGALILLVSACSGTTNQQTSSQAMSADNISLNGVVYESSVKSVFSVDKSGVLCKISIDKIPGSMVCDIFPPDNIIISSQLANDNNGNIYSIGVNSLTQDNFLVKYEVRTNQFSSAKIALPVVLNYNKLLYYANKLYLADPNSATLYKININNYQVETVENFFNPSPAIIEGIDKNGNLHYVNQVYNESAITNNYTSTVYNVNINNNIGSTQFGRDLLNVSDVLIHNNNMVYACTESNFLYLPVGSDANAKWFDMSNIVIDSYFSCDYVTADSTNLYYIEGHWNKLGVFINNYIDKTLIP
jgi:hypothetical protein